MWENDLLLIAKKSKKDVPIESAGFRYPPDVGLDINNATVKVNSTPSECVR